MRRLVWIAPVALTSCSALEGWATTPVDPAVPEGPTQGDVAVDLGTGTLAATLPLYGGILAAALRGAYVSWKGSRAAQ